MANGVNNNIYQGFNDWSQVESMYGNAVSQALQNNNVPLDQVGQVIGSLSSFGGSPAGAGNPNFTGQYDQMAQLINAMGKGGLGGAFGSGNQPQQQSFDPTQNANYPTSLLGAQALQAVGLNPNRQVTTNPTPGQTPSSTEFNKSGVSAVGSPQTTTYGASTPMPQTTMAPSIFSPATPNPPTAQPPSTTPGQPPTTTPGQFPFAPTQQYNAANMPRGGTRGAGTPYAGVPPITPPPAPTAPMGGAGYNGGQIMGFNHGTSANVAMGNNPAANIAMGNTTPTPGMNAPSPNTNVQQKLLSALPRFQDGGTLDAGDMGIVGENGPELISAPDSSPIEVTPISGSVPLGGDVSQEAFNPSLAYGGQGVQPPPQTYAENQPPPAPSGSTAYNTLSTPGMDSFHQLPNEHQPSDMYGAPYSAQAANQQPGPPTPATNTATGVNANKVQQNTIPNAADKAKRQAIANVLKQAGQQIKAPQGSKNPWQPIQSAIPQPPAAPGQVQMKPPPLTGNQNQTQSLAQQRAELEAYYQ